MMDSTPRTYGITRERPASVTYAQIERAAIDILKSGDRPSVLTVRKRLGSGSALTIAVGLKRFWSELGVRAEGNASALRRLPAEVADLAETLWQRAMALADQTANLSDTAARERAQLLQREAELRTHAIGQREKELDAMLRAREQSVRDLEGHVGTSLMLLAQAQETIRSLEAQLERAKADTAAERARTRRLLAPPVRRRAASPAQPRKSVARKRTGAASRPRPRRKKRS